MHVCWAFVCVCVRDWRQCGFMCDYVDGDLYVHICACDYVAGINVLCMYACVF